MMSQLTVNSRFNWPCSYYKMALFSIRSSGLRHGCRLWQFRILKHSPPRLPAKSSGFHVLHQQRTGPKFLAERFMQVFEDVQPRIEPDQIHELERSPGLVTAQ